MLRTTQSFLANLQATAPPLGSAARNLTATAGPLLTTLTQVQPFTTSAVPTLHIASDDAPPLSQLGEQATPVLTRTARFASTLDQFAGISGPATGTLDLSEDNTIAILENWSHAIQYRDTLSHYFRGEAAGTGDLLYSLVDRLMAAAGHAPAGYRRPAAKRVPAPSSSPAPSAPASVTSPSSGNPPQTSPGGLVQGIGAVVNSGLNGVLGGANSATGKLAGVLKAVLGGQGSGGQAPPAQPGQKLSGLLGYLLGR
jgi:hypothetical protein